MESNSVLLVILGMSIAITLYRSIVLFPMKYNVGWVVVSIGIGLLTGIMYLLNPEYAGIFGFAAWAILVIIPSVGTRYVMSLRTARNYPLALTLSRVIRWLHPADQQLSMPDMIQERIFEEQGAIESTIRILERYRDDPRLGTYAQTQIYRLRGQNAELLAWLEANITPADYQRDPSLLQFYVSALGKTGKLNEMLEVFEQNHQSIERFSNEILYVYLLIFTECGLPARVEQLLATTYQVLPEATKAVWLAIATIAAGEVERGTTTLQQLIASDSPIARTSAQRALNKPIVVANEVLTPESQILLAKLERDFEQRQRYQVRSINRRWMTGLLIAVNVAIYLLELQQGGDTDILTLYRLGALYTPAVLEGGEWWRVITATFLHLGIVHLALNMLALYSLGRQNEMLLGKIRFLFVYMTAGIGSMLVILELTEAGWVEASFSLGASGAIMGLVGASVAIYIDDWRRNKSRFARRGLQNTLLIVVLQIILDILIPQTSLIGHLSGATIGFLVTLPLIYFQTQAKK